MRRRTPCQESGCVSRDVLQRTALDTPGRRGLSNPLALGPFTTLETCAARVVDVVAAI